MKPSLSDSPLHVLSLSQSEAIGYRVQGTGPRKIVFVHGLAARSETWSDIAPLFDPDRNTVYLVDLLGSGESSKPAAADYSIPGHARRLIAFIEKESLRGATLIGHSLGGAVVLVAAIEATTGGKTSLLSSIVIIAGPGFIQRLPLMAEIFRNRLFAALFVALYAPDIWIKAGLRMAYYDHGLVDREHIARYAPCYRRRDDKRALVETCRQLVPSDLERIVSRYGELRLPVLLLWGRHDAIVPLSQGTRLEAAITGAKLEVLESCGHNPHEEHPEVTFSLIQRFLADHPL